MILIRNVTTTTIAVAAMLCQGAAIAQQLDIPANLQHTDQQALDLMNKQKAEMCSPPESGMEQVCRSMEEGRQMLLAKMRGDDSPAVAGGQRVEPRNAGCAAIRSTGEGTTRPVIYITNSCDRMIYFSLCVNVQGNAAPTLSPGQTPGGETSRYQMWTPKGERFRYAYRWSETDPAPAASC